jgi:hypothetical protein
VHARWPTERDTGKQVSNASLKLGQSTIIVPTFATKRCCDHVAIPAHQASTMKAAYLIGHGGNDVIAVGERPMPHRRTGEILVRLKAATVNHVFGAAVRLKVASVIWVSFVFVEVNSWTARGELSREQRRAVTYGKASSLE